MVCTEENRKEWELSLNDGYDDGYFENDFKKGKSEAKFKDAYIAGYDQGQNDKYNPE